MEEKYSGPERRRHKRIKMSAILIYRVNQPWKLIMFIGDREINALMADLSEAGMAILTDYDIPVLAILSIKFTLINTYAYDDNNRVHAMEMKGEVRNNVLLETKEYRIGINFTQISEQNKRAIADFVKQTTGR